MARESPQAERPYQALGEAIRMARTGQSMTQEDLAWATGMHGSEISHLEGGKRNPSFRALKRISAGLGIPVWRLVLQAEELEKAEGD